MLASALLVVSCASKAPRLCHTSGVCGDGEACVVGQCVSSIAPSPVAANARRVVLEPESIAYVTSSGEGGAGARLSSVSLGATVGDRARILVKFPKSDWGKQTVTKAFLLLDRAEGAQAGPDEIVVRAASIVEPWSAKADAGTSWASPPNAVSIATGEARISPRGSAPIRIEVTDYAIALGKKDARPWGLRIEAKGDGYGVPIATGFGAGTGPRLEVYLAP